MSEHRLHNRALVRLSASDGTEDVAEFLQGLLTQDVKGTLPVWAGLLTPQGKVLFDLIVWGADGDLLLDCEADAADQLVKRLSIYRLRRKIAIERDDTLGVFWREPLEDSASPDPRLAALGERWIAPSESDSSEAGADDAWCAHRLALGVPEGRAELGDGETLWLECNAVELGGVSFSKGCYIGQENTARMNWRQKINRRLIVVPLGKSNEKRRRAEYPKLGLAVDHLRIEDIPADCVPGWMETGEGQADGVS